MVTVDADLLRPGFRSDARGRSKSAPLHPPCLAKCGAGSPSGPPLSQGFVRNQAGSESQPHLGNCSADLSLDVLPAAAQPLFPSAASEKGRAMLIPFFVCLVYFVVPLWLLIAPRVAAADAPKLHHGPVAPHWIGQSSRFWYRIDVPGGEEFIIVDSERGTRSPAFNQARATAAIKEAKLGAVSQSSLSPDARTLHFRADDRAWTLNLDTYVVAVVEKDPESKPAAGEADAPNDNTRARRARSPDARWEAFARDDNLWLRELASKREMPLSVGGSPGHTYRRDASRARLVSMRYDRADYPASEPDVRWSPDSRRLVAMQTRVVPERRVTLVESSPGDQLQPKTSSYPYLKPGDEIPLGRPHLFDVAAAREIPLDQSALPNPWSLDDVRWAPDSTRFTFLHNQRGHQLLQLLAVDAATGAMRPIFEERSDTFVHYSRSGRFLEHLDRADGVLWASERDGWNHLYLFDASSGRVKQQLTRGEWVVRGIEHLDRERRLVWFRSAGAGGLDDPYYEQLCRVYLDGSGLKVLTPEPGTHTITLSPDRKYFVDTWSRVDAPPVSVLRRLDDGTLTLPLETADATALLAARGGWPERFVAKGRDGTTDIYGIIQRPANFDPKKKYPVIERIYAGPHGYFTPKAFGAHDALLERGFIVVQSDGMGTAGRSKKFHDVAWRNVADAGFPDRIAWIKAAAAKYPELDLSRVGIYGTSAGGQSALGALLFHGDFYHAAASDCGCHDNRMDKIWWNEQWFGWPVGPHYAENSNVTHAAKLRGQLFLAVGELDRNVDPASTYQVANALVRADKPFEYLVMPGAGHGVFRTPYGRKRLEDFFVRAFLDLRP
ncbi:MAG: S9 family peptidase [Opitutus sp.]|nr:S9 family peptidase [Opitutus sp.]